MNQEKMRERPDYSSEEEGRKSRRRSREAAPDTDRRMRESSETSKKSRGSSDLGSRDGKSSRKSEKTRGSSDSEEIEERKRRKSDKTKRRRSRRGYSSESGSDDSSSEDGESESESEYSDSVSESEEERKRRKRRRREEERERKRRKRDKEKRRSRRDDEEEEERRKKKKKKKKKKERKKSKEKERAEKGKTGAVTNSWGKYGIIRETDMWNKRPEFTAWLAEVKQVNLESLANWEEKQMFKEFMEDHNTATFPSKKYYDLDAYHRRQMEKELKKGLKKVTAKERTVFNDEEQRRQELMVERERQKEQEVEALKRSMQGGMAQAMKEQALLKEEMAYQYKLGNFEAAAAIQRRLDPNITM